MTRTKEELVVPDTNVLLHLLKMDATGEALEKKHSLTKRRERPVLSSVVEAELLALARYREWLAKQVEELGRLLSELVRVDTGHPDVVGAYVELYCEARRAGRYRQFRQNDLWIAATARAAGGVLYTCNSKDFDWIRPGYVTVICVDQAR